ncbi:MAG: extracellular solute-binding protein [Mesorhizobium sp.]|nr:MAG: extracellular solute-binding protein [Mesorhizobium sp.]
MFWRPFKEGFEKSNPNYKIRDIPVPYGNFWDKQFVELSASNSPDIVTMFDTEIKSYVEHDFVEPLNSYIEKAGVTLDDFQPGAQAAVKDGNIYGLLFLVNPRAMFYHGGLFRNEGYRYQRIWRSSMQLCESSEKGRRSSGVSRHMPNRETQTIYLAKLCQSSLDLAEPSSRRGRQQQPSRKRWKR